jgi:hypothetical protein
MSRAPEDWVGNRYQRRMHATTGRVTVRRLSVPCWLLLVLGLAAMMAQSFAVHAHSHPAASLALTADIADATGSAATEPGGPHAPAHPLGDDPDCPTCKQSYSGGQFVAPSAALFALPAFINVRIARFVERAPRARVLSHSWQTRAPPIG